MGDYIYGTCSAFGGVFESEIYKLHFIGNAKVNWPAVKNVTSYDVKYKNSEGENYVNLSSSVVNNYYQYSQLNLPGDAYVGQNISKTTVDFQLPVSSDYVETLEFQPLNISTKHNSTSTTNQLLLVG